MEVTVLKSTGVIRRIDELGRIVIPKEIRRNLKIRDGENMEIFIETDSIILKKHSQIEDSINYAKKISALLDSLTSNSIIITDREKIVSVSGSDVQNLETELISKELITIIDNRENFFSADDTQINITMTKTLSGYFSIVPIVTSADSIGLVIIYSKEENNSDNKILTKFIAGLIGLQTDIY